MAHRILVFESDTDFAQILRTGFDGRDVALEVVSEGALGLERAAAEPPDLILLSIELPSMNGFLVCKKIKKNAALKSIPLIILSSDANAAEIFEQHKKLRTRAEDYVRKPVSFEDLLEAVRVFVPINDAATNEPTQVALASNIDDEIDAFAENAFDSLLMDDDIELDVDEMEEATAVVSPAMMEAEFASASAPPPPPEAPAVPPAHPVPNPPESPVAVSEAPVAPSAPPPASIAPPASVPPDSLPPAAASVAPQAFGDLDVPVVDTAALDEANAKLTTLKSSLNELEDEKASLTAHVESATRKVSKLEREVATLRTKGASGVSSREFLDLREQLNTKDKEILDLRDRVSSRDKELVELRDKNIAVERAKADIDDRALASERRCADLEDNLVVVQQDKDSASKRADDLKGRFERSEEKAKGLEGELETAKATASAQVAAAKQEALETKEAAEKAVAEATATSEAAQAEATKKASDAEEAAAAKVAATEEAAAAKMAAAEEAAAAKVAATEEAAAAKVAATEEAAAAKVAAAEESAASQLASLKAENAAALEATLEGAAAAALVAQADVVAARELELEAERDTALEESEASHSKELAVLGRKLADTESKAEEAAGKLAELETAKSDVDAALESRVAEVETATSRIGELEGDLAAMRAAKADLGEQLTAASTKITDDEALLERVRKAMAIGLGLLEEQKNNTVERAAE